MSIFKGKVDSCRLHVGQHNFLLQITNLVFIRSFVNKQTTMELKVLIIFLLFGICLSLESIKKNKKVENNTVTQKTDIHGLRNNDAFRLKERLNKRSSSQNPSIVTVDMSPLMQRMTLMYAREALDRYSRTSDIADHIKDELDKQGGIWHCAVGTSFRSYVHHIQRYYFEFILGNYRFLVFKY
ncbi:uncharacterized protein [Mytilus edulis]|uniref:uncharacterized protein n=1 Tax=Mytilus edulis TaxID=6550 RepID=UPI0039EE8891